MKEALQHFKIPIKGLQRGLHRFDLQVEDEFFSHFENSMIDNGQFEVQLDFNKKDDHSELDFVVEGTTKQICDRCLEEVEIPITGNYKMYLKMSDDLSDDEDIVYISPTASHVNVAAQIYEIISVLLPMRRVCPEVDSTPCNEAVLDRLAFDDTSDRSSSVWNSLQDLDFD